MLFEYVSEVEVLGIEPVTDSSNLRALVKVRVGNMKIDRFRLIQEPGKRAYVSVPQLEYIKSDGGKSFFPMIVILDKQLKRRITGEVLKECESLLSSLGLKEAACQKTLPLPC